MLDFLLAAAGMAAAPAPNISMLDWLVGDWEFVDRAMPVTGEDYEERGTRSCAYALDAQYIRCESSGTARGRTRTYVFYLNYNATQNRFEMLSMWANVPYKGLYVGSVSMDGRRLELQSDTPSRGENGEMRRGWAVITYDGAGTYVWDGGSAPDGTTERGETRFRDTVTRRPPGGSDR